MLYSILLFSVKPQHESATGIHISPPFWTSLPSPTPSHPSRLIQSPFQFPEPYSKFPLVKDFEEGEWHASVTLSSEVPIHQSRGFSWVLLCLCSMMPLHIVRTCACLSQGCLWKKSNSEHKTEQTLGCTWTICSKKSDLNATVMIKWKRFADLPSRGLAA